MSEPLILRGFCPQSLISLKTSYNIVRGQIIFIGEDVLGVAIGDSCNGLTALIPPLHGVVLNAYAIPGLTQAYKDALVEAGYVIANYFGPHDPPPPLDTGIEVSGQGDPLDIGVDLMEIPDTFEVS